MGCLTHNSERDFTKRLFYKIFGILSAAWFSALPVVGALGVVIAPWVRTEVLLIVTRSVHALACALLMYFFLQTNKYQVKISGDDGGPQEVLGEGMLKLTVGPLPDQAIELIERDFASK